MLVLDGPNLDFEGVSLDSNVLHHEAERGLRVLGMIDREYDDDLRSYRRRGKDSVSQHRCEPEEKPKSKTHRHALPAECKIDQTFLRDLPFPKSFLLLEEQRNVLKLRMDTFQRECEPHASMILNCL